MRRTNILKTGCLKSKQQEQGFTLFIVMMVMILVAFLVVAATQSYNTEQRIGVNDADRKFALELAEAALRKGENDIVDFEAVTFRADCQDGLCASAGSAAVVVNNLTIEAETGNTPAWKRMCDSKLCIETNGRIYETAAKFSSKKPRYIIEYIRTQDDGAVIFRVTSRAWGRNKNTVVTLQSYVQVG